MRLTIEKYEKFEKYLIKKGYKKYDQKHKDSDWQYFKNSRNTYGTKLYILGLYFYDYRKFSNRIPAKDLEKPIGVQFEFLNLSENKVDSISLTLSDSKYTLAGFEKFCKKLHDLIQNEL